MSEGISVGVIGLGAMGASMAKNLAAAGLLNMVWNRTSGKAETFADTTGVTVAADPAHLAGVCDVILICVSADEDLLNVIEQMLPSITPGTVVVDTSTVSPATAQKVAAKLSDLNAGFVDAPVSGGVEGARKGTLSVMAGGDSANISRKWVPGRRPRL